MKEIAGSTGNILAVPLDGKFVGMAEIALIVSEPTYRSDGCGGYARIREPEVFRFHAVREGLVALIKTFQESIKEIDRINIALADAEFKSEAEASGEAEGHA